MERQWGIWGWLLDVGEFGIKSKMLGPNGKPLYRVLSTFPVFWNLKTLKCLGASLSFFSRGVPKWVEEPLKK